MDTFDLIALVRGVPTKIGRCTFEQADDLMGAGFAMRGGNGVHLFDVRPRLVPTTVDIDVGEEAAQDQDYLRAILREADAITPDEDITPYLDLHDGLARREDPNQAVATALATTLVNLIESYATAIRANHETIAHDNPWRNQIGFIDLTAGVYHALPVHLLNVKGMDITVAARHLGLSAEVLLDSIQTWAQRRVLFQNASSDEAFWNHVSPIDLDDIASQDAEVTDPTATLSVPQTETLDTFREWVRKTPAYRPGWARFTWPGDYERLPVLKRGAPYPAGEPRSGLYKRVGQHLFRAWTSGRDAGWDESVCGPDGTYQLMLERTLAGTPAIEHIDDVLRLIDVRIGEVEATQEASHTIDGWTKFDTIEEVPAVFFTSFPPKTADEIKEMLCTPLRLEPMTDKEQDEHRAQMVRAPYPQVPPSRGFFRVVMDHLFRVWVSQDGGSCWDESVRAPDGTYDICGEGRALDAIYGKDSPKCQLLVPAGFYATLKAAERRIAEYLVDPDGKWALPPFHEAIQAADDEAIQAANLV